MQEDDNILSQFLEFMEQHNPQDFFYIKSYDDVVLSQICHELEAENANVLGSQEEEKTNVEEFLSISRQELNNSLIHAVDATSMAGDGGCDILSSWRFPKPKGV